MDPADRPDPPLTATIARCPFLHGRPSAGAGPERAVFLDRDGVLVPDVGYLHDPEALRLLPGTAEALRRLRAAGWRLVVVSNQSGVARGLFDLDRLAAIHDRLLALLAAEGAALDALFFCPHHPEGRVPLFRASCDHRKPAPGMLFSAAACLGLRLDACWLIGDQESDMEAARAAGCRAIRVGERRDARADAVAPDLAAAAALILRMPPAREPAGAPAPDRR